MAAMMQHCTFSPLKVLIHCSCCWTVCGLDVLKCSAAALYGWQIMDFFFSQNRLSIWTDSGSEIWNRTPESSYKKCNQSCPHIVVHSFFLITSHPDNRIGSYPILSYPIPSHPILSYPILSYTILSFPSLPSLPFSSLPIPSQPIPTDPIPSCACFISAHRTCICALLEPSIAHGHSCEQKKNSNSSGKGIKSLY